MYELPRWTNRLHGAGIAFFMMARFLQTRQPYKEPTHPGKPSVSFPKRSSSFIPVTKTQPTSCSPLTRMTQTPDFIITPLILLALLLPTIDGTVISASTSKARNVLSHQALMNLSKATHITFKCREVGAKLTHLTVFRLTQCRQNLRYCAHLLRLVLPSQ